MRRQPTKSKDPLLREVFDLIDKSKFSDMDISVRAGFFHGYISELRRAEKQTPSMFLINCVLNVVGYKLTIVKK